MLLGPTPDIDLLSVNAGRPTESFLPWTVTVGPCGLNAFPVRPEGLANGLAVAAELVEPMERFPPLDEDLRLTFVELGLVGILGLAPAFVTPEDSAGRGRT